MENVYFDNSATTKLDENVLTKMLPYFNNEYGNASSIYKIGRESRKAVEDAREKVAKAINCKPNEVYFTSGGTESDNTAIRGIAYAYKEKGNHIITSKIEHPAVLETCKQLEKEGFEVTYLNVDSQGFVKLDELEKAIKKDTILISIMFANNENYTLCLNGQCDVNGTSHASSSTNSYRNVSLYDYVLNKTQVSDEFTLKKASISDNDVLKIKDCEKIKDIVVPVGTSAQSVTSKLPKTIEVELEDSSKVTCNIIWTKQEEI